MTTLAIPKLITAEEFAMMPDCDDMRRELVKGELTELSPPPDFAHGKTQLKAGVVLSQFVYPRGLGEVTAEVGYRISANPDTVRAPDVAFVSARRLRSGGYPRGYPPFAPDIAVEVTTRSDAPSAARNRARIWLDAGSSLVWLMFTASRTVAVYRPNGEVETLGEDDILDAAPVLDGFSAKVSEFFDFYGLYG